MNDADRWLTDLLPQERVVVICGRADDAQAWRDLFGPARCLAIALDAAAGEVRCPTLGGASDQLAWQHSAIAGLDGSGWLARRADTFDPGNTAVLILPDALDPAQSGRRRRVGRRHPTWGLFEDKTVVESLWDSLGFSRARSIITDGPTDLRRLGDLVDRGAGVVCSCQPRGAGPSAGGDAIWWWRDGVPPAGLALRSSQSWRIRLMPLLEGTPVRLHGMVLTDRVVPFLPMELVTLPRTDHGTFLCAGAVPTLGVRADLVADTERIGAGLRERLGYRGGFSVDGILTAGEFLPTDLNTRLTSAMEAASPELRVRLHSANLLARANIDLDSARLDRLVANVFAASDTYTLYGAATRARDCAPEAIAIRWEGHQLVPASDPPGDGRLTVAPSPRGWLLTAALTVKRLPTTGLVGHIAPQVFQLSDRLFGTDFGNLASPFQMPAGCRPTPSGDATTTLTQKRP